MTNDIIEQFTVPVEVPAETSVAETPSPARVAKSAQLNCQPERTGATCSTNSRSAPESSNSTRKFTDRAPKQRPGRRYCND